METDGADQLDFFEVLDGNRGTTQDGNPADDLGAYFAARIESCRANRRRIEGAGDHLPAPPGKRRDAGRDPSGE